MSTTSVGRSVMMWIALVLLVGVTIELLAFGAFRIASGAWFSHAALEAARRAVAGAPVETGEDAKPELGATPGFATIHPYLGYVYDPNNNSDAHTANHRNPISPYGFLNAGSSLPKKSPERLIVGVFGGSVAYWLSSIGESELVATLKKHAPFGAREIVIVRYALGGYKQPQQLLALAYHLSLGAEFDLVLNIDGFNEVALPPAENTPRGVFPHYPANWFLSVGGLDDPQLLAVVASVEALKRQRAGAAERFSNSLARFSVLGNFAWHVRDRWAESDIVDQYEYLRDVKSRLSSYQLQGPAFAYESDEALYQDLTDAWAAASIQMSSLAATNGAWYFHFLQPNQYVRDSKPMQDEERAVAILVTHPYREGAIKGYPLLRAAGARLQEQGIAFHDLTMLFREERASIYIDACCHYNERGNQILARAIGEAVLRGVER